MSVERAPCKAPKCRETFVPRNSLDVVCSLTASQWRDIEKASVYLPQDGRAGLGRYIGLGVLRNVIRQSKRSTSQNALLWALYSDALKQGGETLGGWTSEDVHDSCSASTTAGTSTRRSGARG